MDALLCVIYAQVVIAAGMAAAWLIWGAARLVARTPAGKAVLARLGERRKAAPASTSLPRPRRLSPMDLRRRGLRGLWNRWEGPDTERWLALRLADRGEPAELRLECARLLMPRHGRSVLKAVAGIVLSRREPSLLRTGLIALMAEHGGEEAVRVLLAALRVEDVHVMIAAEVALRRMATEVRRPGINLYAAVVRGLARSIRNARRPWRHLRQLRVLAAVERSYPMLPPSEETVRALTGVFDRATLGDPYSERAAAMAAEFLGEFRIAEALPALEGALRIESDLVRYKVVEAMARLGRRVDLPALGYIATHDFLRRIRARAVDSALAIHKRFPAPRVALP